MNHSSIILATLLLGACGQPDPAQPTPTQHQMAQPAPTPTAQEAKPEAPPSPDAAVIHTCPMHPEVRQEGPGDCPTCGMSLVPADDASEGSKGDEAHEAHEAHEH